MEVYTLKEISSLNVGDEIYFHYHNFEDGEVKGIAKVHSVDNENIYFQEEDGSIWDFPFNDSSVDSDKAHQNTGDYTFTIYKK